MARRLLWLSSTMMSFGSSSLTGRFAAPACVALALNAACGEATLNITHEEEAGAAALPVYRVEVPDLQIEGETVQTSVAFSINEKGDVVGTLVTEAGRRAYHWRQGNTVHLGNLESGDMASIAYDINTRGMVVGSSGGHGGQAAPRAFMWVDGVATELPSLDPENPYGEAFGANDRGDIVGSSGPPENPIPAIWQFQRVKQLKCLREGLDGGQSFGVTPSGAVAGGCQTPNGFTAVMWTDPDTAINLGRLPYASEEFGMGTQINSKNQVAGVTSAQNGRHAFFWDGHEMIDLGDLPGGDELSIAYGLNSHGHVVGSSQVLDGGGNSFSAEDPALLHHAFLWTPETGMIDLNTLIDDNDPLKKRITLLETAIITDTGIITGRCLIDGKIRAYVLRPSQQ